MYFIPLALDTLGPFNERGITLITHIGRHTRQTQDEMRETSFLFQRVSLSVIIQRFNTVAFAGGFAWTFAAFQISFALVFTALGEEAPVNMKRIFKRVIPKWG